MHDVVEEHGDGADGACDVGHGGPEEGVFGFFVFHGGGEAAGFEPDEGAAACVELDGEGDEGEERGDAEECDVDPDGGGSEEEEAEDAEHHEVVEEVAGEADGGDHLGAKGEPAVGFLVLDGVAAFVGGDGGGGDGVHGVDGLTEVDGFVRRVVVVGELAWGADDADVGDAVLAEHGFRDLGAGEADGDVGILVEAAFEGAADDEAGEHGGRDDEDTGDGEAEESLLGGEG